MAAVAREPREKGVREKFRRILMPGGSAGSPFLNDKVPLLLARVRDLCVPLTVRHQSGDGETERVRLAYHRLELDAQVEAFFGDMATAYSQSGYRPSLCCSGSSPT